MLSITCKNAIKAVIYLCSRFESNQNSGVKEIATFIGASEHSVGKLLQTLVKKNVIKSLKGPTGGFYISEDQKLLPIISIVEAIDGMVVFKECGLGLSRCSSSHPCPIHDDYKIIRDHMENLFRSKKVIDLCEPITHGLAYLTG